MWDHVDSKIFFVLIALLVISTAPAYAQESIVTVQTDNSNYDQGDTIVISGTVSTIIGETPISLQLFFGENIVHAAQITVAQDGSYSDAVIADGSLWERQGQYQVKATYGERSTESTFSYTPKVETVLVQEEEGTKRVDAGSKGTFNVKYAMKGGTVKDIILDWEGIALKVEIDTTDKGVIILDIPREFIGAEESDGRDADFIILVDKNPTEYEDGSFAEIRKVTVNFEAGAQTIEIIGTYAIPEFGAVVMIILFVAIMTTVVFTQNRLKITI